MDIMIQREVALKSLQAINSIVEKKQLQPVLANVLLNAEADQLLLKGTDTEIEFVGVAKLETVTQPGIITVSARKLFDICRTLEEGSCLQLVLQGNSLIVRTGKSYFTLNALSPEGFPEVKVNDYPIQFSFPQKYLKHLLTKTYFAMGVQDSRHYLNGLLLEIEQAHIHCVAMDGHRLACATLIDSAVETVTTRLIIPRKSVIELMRLLGGDDDQMTTLHLSDKQLRVVTNDFIFTSKLLNTQYPNYRRLIVRGQLTAIIEREAIRQALIRVSVLSHEKIRGVRCHFDTNKLTMLVRNVEQEQAEEVVALDYAGSPIVIAFNVAYLLDVLSVMSAKMVKMTLTNASTGVILEAVEEEGCLYVVMPMRL